MKCLLISLVLVMPLAAQVASQAPKVPAGSLRILDFRADRTTINPGEAVTLIWDVDGARGASITPGVGNVNPRRAQTSVRPTETTGYVLTATGANGQSDTRRILITVRPRETGPSTDGGARGGPPKAGFAILSFRADKAAIIPGQDVTLYWDVQGAARVTLMPGGEVSAQQRGQTTVRPTETTTYILSASGPNNQTESRRVTVTVESRNVPNVKKN